MNKVQMGSQIQEGVWEKQRKWEGHKWSRLDDYRERVLTRDPEEYF